MTVARLLELPHAGARWLVVAAWLALATAPVAAQSPAMAAGSTDVTFGFQVFHSLLESRGLSTTTDLQEAHDDPANSVIVLLGDLSENDLLARARLRSFLERGGCVLLASDSGAWANDLCVMQRGPVLVEPEFEYQGHADCPRVSDLHRSHSLLSGVGELIANRSGYLETLYGREGHWQRLAVLPVAGEDRVLMAVMQPQKSRRGRLLAIADHSLLINGMVLHGDNARFLLNLSHWLSANGRSRLFIAVDGLPLTANGQAGAGSAKLPSLPPPEELPPVKLSDLKDLPADMWLPFANQLIAAMEDADLDNELVANRPRELEDRFYRRALYFLAGLAALAIVLRQLLRGAQRVDPPRPPATGSRLAARVERFRRNGQMGPAVQAMARDLLKTLTGIEERTAWRSSIRGARIDAGWLTRWRVRRGLRQLHAIAIYSGASMPMPSRPLAWLSRRVAEIQSLDQQQRIHWPDS